MNRERAFKAVLVLVGLLFTAGIYPLVVTVRSELQTHNESAELLVATAVFGIIGALLIVLAPRTQTAGGDHAAA